MNDALEVPELKGRRMPMRRGVWMLDEDDLLLAGLLQDPIYATELLWSDPTNGQYGGCYRVRDYQYVLNRPESVYQGHACARTVGKTESIKAKTFVHAFRRHGENLLLTAPELIHLLPLTDAVEQRIRDTRLTREFLDTGNGRTGFTHRPFGVKFADGTEIVGRIPRREGTGVKGQHQPDLLLDEGQDYPERGWIEVHETVMKDHVDEDGTPDFSYEFYGVHSGARDTGFSQRAAAGAFKVVQVTAMQRPGWGKSEKDAAKAAYGGTGSPDYRRNILGEPGGASSAFFVLSRLMACVDQDRDSHYNTVEYDIEREHLYRAEELDELGLTVPEALDLPSGYKNVWAGMDVGLTNSPTVITLWTEQTVKATGEKRQRPRLKLFRMLTLERFRSRQIVEAWLAVGAAYGPKNLRGFGMDMTGLGFPIKQAMEDDQGAPQWLQDVTRGYFFNAQVPVGVDETVVDTERMRDQFGAAVKVEPDPVTGIERYVTYMPMIEASTRYLREWVDTGLMMLPFDVTVVRDMSAETDQRVKQLAGVKKKPNAFHILDSMRAMAMVRHAEDIEDQLGGTALQPVLDSALDLSMAPW
jgi:hypothetical protein